MNRFIVLIFLYLSSLILFLAFNQYGFVDSIIFGVFILSVIWYVFAKEELPQKKLNVPAVHYYQKSRVNIYGYFMVGLLALLSLFFVFFTQVLSIRLGIAILVLWLVMLITSYYAAVWSNTNAKSLIISDFIRNSVKFSVDFDLNAVIRKLLGAPLPFTGSALYSLITSDKNFKLIDKNKLEQVIKLFIVYIEGTRDELVPGEIEEINKR